MGNLFRFMLATALTGAVLLAEDKPAPEPRVTAMVPLAVPQGFSGSLRLRGVRMKEASEVRAGGVKAPDRIEIREKKDAGAPAGTKDSVKIATRPPPRRDP